MKTLLDPMSKPPSEETPAEFPFQWKPPLETDVRATWDRLCPGWNKRRASRAVVRSLPIKPKKESA